MTIISSGGVVDGPLASVAAARSADGANSYVLSISGCAAHAGLAQSLSPGIVPLEKCDGSADRNECRPKQA